MTNRDIYSMKAGRELDALVAEKVMTWSRLEDDDGVPIYNENHQNMIFHRTGFYPSTDISTAWEVQEKIMNNGHPRKCEYIRQLSDLCEVDLSERRLYEIGELLLASPEQRCKAALFTVMEVPVP